jgi:hypothetical protein
MKYYKLLNGEGWGSFQEGRIYSGNEGNPPCDVEFHATKGLFKDWEEVPEKEYLFQEATDRYPIGTKFKVAHNPNHIYTVKSHDRYKYTFFGNLHINLLIEEIDNEEDLLGASVYHNGKWGEIVSKPKENMNEVQSLEKGRYYKVKDNGVILRYDSGSNALYYLGKSDNTINSFCRNGGNFTEIPSEYIYVTKEEIEWLEKCNELDRFITKEEFENMKKKIIGYKLIKPEYKGAINALQGTSDFGFKDFERIGTTSYTIAIKKFEEAGVLDLWFQPVYENTTPDITINGYKAVFHDDYVEFGCQKYDKDFVLQLGNFLIDSGLKITNQSDIMEVYNYYNKK